MGLKIIGIGGASRNILSALIDSGVDRRLTLNIDTDINAQSASKAPFLQIGKGTCNGLGAVRDDVGLTAAKESEDDIKRAMLGIDEAVIVAGLGGGCGTGALPHVAQLFWDSGIKPQVIVTTPPAFEGERRASVAREGIRRISAAVGRENLFILQIKDNALKTAYEEANLMVARAIKAVSSLPLDGKDELGEGKTSKQGKTSSDF